MLQKFKEPGKKLVLQRHKSTTASYSAWIFDRDRKSFRSQTSRNIEQPATQLLLAASQWHSQVSGSQGMPAFTLARLFLERRREQFPPRQKPSPGKQRFLLLGSQRTPARNFSGQKKSFRPLTPRRRLDTPRTASQSQKHEREYYYRVIYADAVDVE